MCDVVCGRAAAAAFVVSAYCVHACGGGGRVCVEAPVVCVSAADARRVHSTRAQTRQWSLAGARKVAALRMTCMRQVQCKGCGTFSMVLSVGRLCTHLGTSTSTFMWLGPSGTEHASRCPCSRSNLHALTSFSSTLPAAAFVVLIDEQALWRCALCTRHCWTAPNSSHNMLAHTTRRIKRH
jgi:hypothetical protein